MRSRPDNIITLYLVLWEVLVQAWREGGKGGGEEDDSVAYFTTFEAPLGAGLILASSMYEQSTNHIPEKKRPRCKVTTLQDTFLSIPSPMNIYLVYEEHMSLALNGSSAIQCFKCSDAIQNM